MNRQKCEKCQACQTEDGKKCIICNKYRSPDTCPNDCCFNPKGKRTKNMNSCDFTELFIIGNIKIIFLSYQANQE